MDLVREIEAVFGVGDPPKEPLVEAGYLGDDCQGDEGATDFFCGKSWVELDIEGLRYHEAAMYMFTPEVHRYYLPAFMVASLSDRKAADVIPDHVVFHLADHKNPFWTARINALSQAELKVVCRFLETMDDGRYGNLVKEAIFGLIHASAKNS